MWAYVGQALVSPYSADVCPSTIQLTKKKCTRLNMHLVCRSEGSKGAGWYGNQRDMQTSKAAGLEGSRELSKIVLQSTKSLIIICSLKKKLSVIIRKTYFKWLPFQLPAHYRHLPCKCEYCTSATRDSPYVFTPLSRHALKKPVWQASDWARPTALACDCTLRRLQWKCVGGERRAKQRKAKGEEGGVPWNAPLSLPPCFLSGAVMLRFWPPRLRFWRLCLPVVLRWILWTAQRT